METKKMTVEKLFKKMLFDKEMTPQQVADKMNKTRQNIQIITKRGRLTLVSMHELLDACGEKFVILLSDGSKVELDIEKPEKLAV